MSYLCRKCGKPISIEGAAVQVAIQEGRNQPTPKGGEPRTVVKTCPHCGELNQFTVR